MADLDDFTAWFEQNNGFIDKEYMGFTVFSPEEGGRGAVALKDIPEGHTLFTIPRTLTLSTRTSELPHAFGLEAWKSANLHQGWAGLILCMMWEEAKGQASKWGPYLASLPSRFDTPVFWSDEDLTLLEGTTVVGKLGREDAERTYNEIIVPALQSHPELFSAEAAEKYYTLTQYHLMGSRILSRSFDVERWEGEGDDEENEAANTSRDMDVDEPEPQGEAAPASAEDAVEEEEEEDPSDVAMVPVADLLNARFECENAKLFYEEKVLKMISTKPIKAGEQIWNTYGDLPNSELLRRYGHVDLLPLPNGKKGNPGDVVELPANIVAAVVTEKLGTSQATAEERIDWWLEEGGDDVYVLDNDLEIPPTLASFAKLIGLSPEDWKKAKGKGKPPKAIMDQSMVEILREVLRRRLQQYPTSEVEDEKALEGELPLNARHATVVRLGEKRILSGILSNLKDVTKRKRDEEERSGQKGKKSRK
ncbi:SET domain-containing protein [Cylindrobasidium torrendii FP15055 ss-10]|uniref:SET domain-containing protein n=1 Tax=Cylindrobasidium torrendii FP15055 ss-10 TaxID=1314674 RepID=A0A0D7BM07_9AGAR|nr:SET domain-containing protein [Cylindrobasidium torrendii FP15055 ss-10]